MIRGRFLKQLAAVAVLVVATTAASTQAAHANEANPTVSASTADRAPAPPPGAVLANGSRKVVPGDGNSVQTAWGCAPGFPCLYDYDNGLGNEMLLNDCGWWHLSDYWVRDSGTNEIRLANDWANSARTQGNSITVYNWTGAAWDNWGTVPAYQYWNFQLKNQIDAVNVNCSGTPAPL